MSPSSSWWDTPINIDETATTPREWLQTAYLRMSDATIAEVLSKAVGKQVLVNQVTILRQRLNLRKTASGQPVIFQESEAMRFDAPPVITTDDVLVLADVEVPFHDAAWCSDVVGLAIKWDIKTLILAGDFFHLRSLSSFSKRFLASGEHELAFTEEIAPVACFSDTLLQHFDEVLLVLGNHEARLVRRLDTAMHADSIKWLLGFRLEKRFQVSAYYYAEVMASTGKWTVTHPKEAQVIPVRVAGRLADKYESHIVAAHGHDWGETTSVAGRYAAACGCGADIRRLDYPNLRQNLRPKMQQGAFILHEGLPVLLHPKYAPPSMWL